MVHNQHSRYSTSNLFSISFVDLVERSLPQPELEQHHQGAQFFRVKGLVEGIILKHQTRAPAPWLGHFPCFSPSSPHNPSKCLPHWLSGKCDEFDQEKKHFSPSSIKFCECPERRWSLDSSRIYDCKQTVILLHNCPIALLWNILKFYGIEKVSIFKSSLNHKNREVTSRGKSEWLFLQDFWVIRLIFNLSCIWSII